MEPPVKPSRSPRAPKPSQRLDDDARRILGTLLGSVDIERIAVMASQSESTIRRFADGATGARASVRMLTQAIVVAACEHAREFAATERETLERLSRESTPGGVGLHLAALVSARPATRAHPPTTRARVPVVGNDAR